MERLGHANTNLAKRKLLSMTLHSRCSTSHDTSELLLLFGGSDSSGLAPLSGKGGSDRQSPIHQASLSRYSGLPS